MESDASRSAVEKLSGTIEHITYTNQSNGYTVAVLNLSDDKITVVGTMPFVAVGDFVALTGVYDSHPKVCSLRYGVDSALFILRCDSRRRPGNRPQYGGAVR